MDFVEAEKKLTAIRQTDLLKDWDQLSMEAKKLLLKQIEQLDLSVFHQQQQLIATDETPSVSLESFDEYAYAGNKAHQTLGFQLIQAGKVGCLLIAGGQGTRLRIQGPKGTFPITPFTHKSLFQLVAEKVVAAGKQAGRLLPLAIMTSPQNHEETIRFFKESDYFGLPPAQLDFFMQGELPLLSSKGDLFLEAKGKMASGPDGNGFALNRFLQAGIWDKWRMQGVEYLNFILIDNPLADPFDQELVGFHLANQLEVTVKCAAKLHPDEKVGVLVADRGHVRVVEYSELSEAERHAYKSSGELRHGCANLSLFCFSMEFIQKVSAQDLPLHKAFKASKFLTEEGETILSEQPIAWKFERFIFDLLEKADRVKALLYPREECFAPLKNFSGSDSVEQVQAALLHQAKRVMEKITGVSFSEANFELAPEFFYPTPILLERWQGRSPPNDRYITS